MRFNNIIMCTLLTMLMLMPTVFASNESIDVNFGTREVTLIGKYDKASFNRMISIEVTKQSDPSKLVHIGTIRTAYDGSYTYTFVLPENTETGSYNVVLGIYGQEKFVLEQPIYYAIKEVVDALLNTANTEEDRVRVESAIATDFEVLNMPKEWYTGIDYENRLKIADNVKASRTYASIGELKDVIHKNIALYSFYEANTGSEMKTVFSLFESLYNITSETIPCYGVLDTFGLSDRRETNKEKIYDILATFKSESFDDIRKAYAQSILLNAINCSKDPDEIKTYLDNESYKDIFGFDLGTYNKSNKDKTVKDIYALSDIMSMDGLKVAIENSYNKQLEDANSNSGGGGGGGGGSPSSNKGSSIPTISLGQTPTFDTGSNTDKFTDIGNVSWAKDAILSLESKGIISGMGDGKFAPNNNVTREQFAKMIAVAFSLNSQKTAAFEDITESHWAYDAINAVYSCGVVNGISETEFGVGANITRQDMAVMLYRAAKYAGYNIEKGDLNFKDNNQISNYATEAVGALSKIGVINGYTDGTFGPKDTATRAQAAKIIYEIIK